MRWRIDLSYKGTNYSGWQKQSGDKTVQQTIEEAFSTILREPIEIVGCGRTDAGVNARKYAAHFDANTISDSAKVLYQVNSILPDDIAINFLEKVKPEFHARYDARERHYLYYIHFNKNPFLIGQSFYFGTQVELDKSAMQDAAKLLMNYNDFLPFCKTGSDEKHFKCMITESKWDFENEQAIYSIKANRFLRGMVRLITGAYLNIGLGKLSIDSLEESLRQQIPLPLQWSVPPEGLFLEEVIY